MPDNLRTFRDTESGLDTHFFARSQREVLDAKLNVRLTEEPTEDQRRAALATTSNAEVDSASEWAACGGIATSAIADADRFAGEIAQRLRDMRQMAYANWLALAKEDWATRLLADTEKVRTTLAAVRARYAGQAIPFPVTSPDIAALNVRLGVLEHAGPDEARALVEDAERRDDKPFLAMAGSYMRGWLGHRNSWNGAESRDVAAKLLAIIDRATWTPANAQAEYCVSRAERTAHGWTYLVNKIKDASRFDPIHRQTGALSPLLEPLAK